MIWAHITNFDTQRNDPCGQGSFGATRTGGDLHEGEDILVNAGELINSPIDGIITREGAPYTNDPFYKLIEIKGTGTYSGQLVKIMYAVPLAIGINVLAGDPIGTAQAISDKYECEMYDHLHITVEVNGVLENPAPYLYGKSSPTPPPKENDAIGMLILGFVSYKLYKRWTKNFS